MSKRIVNIVIVGAVMMTILQGGAQAAELVLVQEGASAYRIVSSATATRSEIYAAKELQRYIKESTEVEIPFELEGPQHLLEIPYPMILIGEGPTVKKLLGDAQLSYEEQGYRMITKAPHLIIAGTAQAGTLYGVYDFLERFLDLRRYAPGVTHCPKKETLILPELDYSYSPPFHWRHTSYAWPGGDVAYRSFMRDNAGSGDKDYTYGRQYTHDSRAHSYFRFISPDKDFDAHPEYFLEIGGVRLREETQLCLTNPEVFEIVLEKMLKKMEAGAKYEQFNFSQKDHYNCCECPQCRAMNEKHQSQGGTQFWFVNKLAEETSKLYPDKMIGTLAYMYTEEPPVDLEMHPNVAVWLCHMFPSCDSHPIVSCEKNADYKRRALAWSKICKHLYIWHYCVDFAHYYNPFPNFRALASDIKFYRDIGVEGIYLQGMGHRGGGGEFSLLRPYYGMKLLWNPDLDADALMQDFLNGYYGAAAKPIYQYIQMLLDKVTDEHIHMHLYSNPAMGYLTDDILSRALALFDEAEKAVASDEELLERVKVARMPLTYARIFPRNGYEIEGEDLSFPGLKASMEETLEMYNRMGRHGFSTLREMSGEPEQLSLFCHMMNGKVQAPVIENKALKVHAVPFFGGRILQIIDKKSGECITANNIPNALFFPFAGGEETRLDGIFRPKGLFEQFGVMKHSKDAIGMVAKVAPWELRRRVSLVGDEPILKFAVEVTNVSDKPVDTLMRSHLELDLGDLDENRVRFTNRKGEAIERDMVGIIKGLREGEHYRDQQTPKGQWVFTGSKGLEVTQRFDDEQVDFSWLYSYPEELNELEAEVWIKKVRLEPKAKYTFNYEIEVRPMK